ncbi:MAG: D-alanine--D-alanine ligase [Deltaproteobacteria bacterium]|nr:D-alanine--D-alanine ligase [Deltaproteobacteria bacterium]
MRIGIIHTVGSPCRCAEAAAEGLRALGHETVLADSEEIESIAVDLARDCELVIDHTDTFKGRGLLRAFVRQVLESAGARIVGSGAQACFLADNKIAAKGRLSSFGLPVPPGIVITRKGEEIPPWLQPPLILKPAFEHMSRGLRIAATRSEAESAVNQILDSHKQPILVEKYIFGREVAVSVLDGPDGPQPLPILEWVMEKRGEGVLTESFKLTEPPPNRHDALKADLPPEKAAEIRDLALAAFQTLNLRDYARFDLRLSEAGHPFLLEANITPSLESQEAFALSARWAGLDYPGLIERMIVAAQTRYAKNFSLKEAEVIIDLPVGIVTMTVPNGVHVPPQSTIDLAKILDIKAGDRVLELGCGSGLLSIAAAKSGAAYVLATDLDPVSLNTTRSNARRNGVADRVEVAAGAWFEAVPREEREKGFNVILATPPQTPGHKPFGPKYGGHDGTGHLLHIVEEAPKFLKSGNDRLWILAISLANPGRLLQRLRDRFSEVKVLKETNRFFTRDEYESYAKGLFAYLQSLKNDQRCEFQDAGGERYVFRNLFICARGGKKKS